MDNLQWSPSSEFVESVTNQYNDLRNASKPVNIEPKKLFDILADSKMMFLSEFVKDAPYEKIIENIFVKEVIANFDCFKDIIQNNAKDAKVIINLLNTTVNVIEVDPLACTRKCDSVSISQISLTRSYYGFCKGIGCNFLLTMRYQKIMQLLNDIYKEGVKQFKLTLAKTRINALQNGIVSKDTTIDLTMEPIKIRNKIIDIVSPKLDKIINPVLIFSQKLIAELSKISCLMDCTLDAKTFKSIAIGEAVIPIITSQFLESDTAFILYDVERLLSLPTQTEFNNFTIGRLVNINPTTKEEEVERFIRVFTEGDMRTGVSYLLFEGKDNGLIVKTKKEGTENGEDGGKQQPKQTSELEIPNIISTQDLLSSQIKQQEEMISKQNNDMKILLEKIALLEKLVTTENKGSKSKEINPDKETKLKAIDPDKETKK